VTVTADATTPGGLGTYGWMTRGGGSADCPDRPRPFPGLHVVARDRGRLRLDEHRGDAAESWNRIPLIRMTNVNLEPGTPAWRR